MSPFEYVIVLISIILGLGIALVLTGIAELIKRWKSCTHFWPYLIWILVVFVLHIQEWWATYDLRSVKSWSLLIFLFVILYPILLFVLANLLFPSKWPKKGIDIKEFYFNNCKKFFVCIVLFAILSIVQNVVIANYRLQDQLIQFSVLLIFTIMILRPTRSITIHTSLSLVMLIMMLIGLFLTKDLSEI
ncbi:MAG: hypothetical protein OEU76_08630 [Cyclobacteriaceae bacterium]|nr:hypothetical protein [Cyclobacteriaceae bacterium]